MNKITTSPEETKELAAKLALKLKPGHVLALEGELGSGKTCFVQGLAQALGIPNNRYVRSPSFTLINEYQGKIPLYHFDFYRLNNPAEVADLGIEEYFDGQGITVVEWANKFPGTLPERTVHIRFEIISENERKISFNNGISL
ncbi:MAG: tRNA (adenosine(37)-N6)-threonylcarbamoyltransferase complex ATPase subunit type 1 TsaE [Pseudomonadota bacterium]